MTFKQSTITIILIVRFLYIALVNFCQKIIILIGCCIEFYVKRKGNFFNINFYLNLSKKLIEEVGKSGRVRLVCLIFKVRGNSWNISLMTSLNFNIRLCECTRVPWRSCQLRIPRVGSHYIRSYSDWPGEIVSGKTEFNVSGVPWMYIIVAGVQQLQLSWIFTHAKKL